MNGTWSCHSNGQQYMQGIVEGCGTLSELDVLTGNWVPLKENIYKTTFISKNNHITSPLSLCSHHWSFKNPSPDESIIVILEYTSSNCVKLFYHLSDLPEPLINCISSEISSDTSSQPVDSCFIYIHVHGFPRWRVGGWERAGDLPAGCGLNTAWE